MPTIDTERFRLRNFVDKLVDLGECEVHNAPIDLLDVGGVLDGNPHAVLFKAAGPEKAGKTSRPKSESVPDNFDGPLRFQEMPFVYN